jgi:superfamily II DNA or RNA helicase
MKDSSKEFSTFNFSQQIKTKEEWISWHENHSKVFQKFGSFLPTQTELLDSIYTYFATINNVVSVFTAPPASGKTHVISLIAYYFANKGLKTCIVIPNEELKQDFENEKMKIEGMSRIPDIITFTNYLENKEKYDFVVIDEAHNLDSAFNMNRKIVKHFSIKMGDNGFELIIERFLKNKKFVVIQLTLEYASEILNLLTSNRKHVEDVKHPTENM